MNLSQKGFAALAAVLIVLFLAAVAAGSYVYFYVAPSPVPAAQTPAQLEAVDTSNWQGYQWNGLELKYPANWIVEKTYYQSAAQQAQGLFPENIGLEIFPRTKSTRTDFIAIGGHQASCEPSQNHVKCDYIEPIANIIYTDSKNQDILKIYGQMLSTFKFIELQKDKEGNQTLPRLKSASICILEPYPQPNLYLINGVVDYKYDFEISGDDLTDYQAELKDDKFLIADVDADGSNEAVIFVTEWEKSSHIYPLYMQVLENENGQWVCSGEQNAVFLDSYGLSIYSVSLNDGLIILNRQTDFDRREMTSRDVEETYKFENGKLIKVQGKTIKLHDPLG